MPTLFEQDHHDRSKHCRDRRAKLYAKIQQRVKEVHKKKVSDTQLTPFVKLHAFRNVRDVVVHRLLLDKKDPQVLNAQPGTWQATALEAWKAIASDFWTPRASPGASQPTLKAFVAGRSTGSARWSNP